MILWAQLMVMVRKAVKIPNKLTDLTVRKIISQIISKKVY
jgi:hypothetical protein